MNSASNQTIKPATPKAHHSDLLPIQNAVILAAGKSMRFRENGMQKPKVLLKVGGLRLLERAILTLHEGGVRHFRIVVGAYREQVVPEMQSIARLRDIDIEYVVCEDYEKGNGVTFAAGAAGFDEPFLLTMSDHIFSPETVEDFVRKATSQPQLPALACDGNLAGVFDMDDATKVAANGTGFIQNIGKEITEYDLVDTGLFYFPKGYGKKVKAHADAGAHSVSGIIQHFINDSGVRATALDHAVWQDVDNPDMKHEAERRMMRMLRRPEDGWVARNINRHFSTRLSLLFANAGMHPAVVTTMVFLLTMVGAWFASSGAYQGIVIGGLIFQLASILDGCDGELARLTYRKSKYGALYESLAGSLRFVIFFEALGISAWKATGSQLYMYAVGILAAVAIYMLSQMASFAWQRRNQTQLLPVFPHWSPFGKTSSHKPNRNEVSGFLHLWQELNKQDVTAFLTLILCLFFLYKAMFWLALLGILTTAVMISRSVHAAADNPGAQIFERVDPIYFYLAGVAILCALVFYLEDLDLVLLQLEQVGSKVFLVFGIAMLWILSNTMCIRTLVRGKVPFPDLLFNQMTGDAYNTIIPLAGLGGEPYKIKHLTQWLDWQTASKAVVVDRLIHATTGMVFAATCMFFTLVFVPMEGKYLTPLAIVSAVFALGGAGMVWLALSNAPSKISSLVLQKLKIVEEYRNDPLPAGRFFLAFFFKFLGRTFNLIELFAIFYILGFSPEVIHLVAVAGMVATSATLFFIFPMGIGVNELGISGALALVGYPTALGPVFGLIRRARLIFWALIGVSLHFVVVVSRRMAVSRAKG